MTSSCWSAGRRIGTEIGDFAGEHDDDENQKRFQQERCDQAAVGKDSKGSFSGETRRGAGESGADGGGELLPARRPLDQELGSVVEGGGFFGLESFNHGLFEHGG